jgi:hypothetical protein
MMQISFLTSSKKLVKKFTQTDEGLNKQSYPLAKTFTSHTHEVNDIGELKQYVEGYSKHGACLLKGNPVNPNTGEPKLKNESRAGSTDPATPTSMLVLDVDGLHASLEELYAALPSQFKETQHLVQYSASYKVESNDLRVHLFYMLQEPAQPTTLKNLALHLNLNTPTINTHASQWCSCARPNTCSCANKVL